MKLRKPIILLSVILTIFILFAGCGVLPTPTTGGISGRVTIPASGEMSKDVSGWVPVAGAEVTITDADGVTHTVTTDENGYYIFENIAVNPNTVITATVEINGEKIVLKKVIPVAVAEDENYDAGTITAEDTALALAIEVLINAGMNPADIDPEEIKDVNSFDDLVEQITTVTEDGNNVTEDSDVADKVDDIVDKIMNPSSPTPGQPQPVIVPITGVSINQEDQLLAKGSTLNLTVTIEPANATNKNVTWASDDEAAATVSVNGTVTTISEGTATITVTTEDGSKTDAIEITVASVVNSTQGKGYDTINDAIIEANTGDTILVGTGTYPENLLIDKSINLIGMGIGNTIIEGSGTLIEVSGREEYFPPAIITIGGELDMGISSRDINRDTNPIVSDVSISGFSIVYPEDFVLSDGLTNMRATGTSALDLIRADDGKETVYIENFGVIINGSSSCEISNNEIITYGGAAIALSSSSNNNISDNLVRKNEFGIILEYSDNNYIEDNQISESNSGIILFGDCRSNSIHGNSIENEEMIIPTPASARDASISDGLRFSGIALTNGSSYNSVSSNTIINYLIGILAEDNSHQNSINDNTISNFLYGIILRNDTQVNTVSGNTVDNSGIDIEEYESMTGAKIMGIILWDSCYTIISQNIVKGNRFGIQIIDAFDNRIEENIIYNNMTGFEISFNDTLTYYSPNYIFKNKIYDNTDYGIDATINPTIEPINIDISGNWWGDATGPKADCNPDGEGNNVIGSVDLYSWYMDEAMTKLYYVPGN
jgi:parallel beta-helix repeat protein